MASILNVDQINNAAGTSGIALDASTGKPSFPNGAVLPAGSVVRMGSEKLTSYFTTTTSNVWFTAETFSITGVTSGNTVYIHFSPLDLVQTFNDVYWRILNNNSVNIGQWGRETASDGSWRGIRSNATFHDYDTAGGTRSYTVQMLGSTGAIYYNYPSGITDHCSFLTWWEVAQ